MGVRHFGLLGAQKTPRPPRSHRKRENKRGGRKSTHRIPERGAYGEKEGNNRKLTEHHHMSTSFWIGEGNRDEEETL